MPLFCKSPSSTLSSDKSSPRPPPKGITCTHCHQTDVHYSVDCPLSCDFCGKKGHEVKDCTPRCLTCYGRGEIQKTKSGEEEDPRPSVRLMKATLDGMLDARAELKKEFYGRLEAAEKEKVKNFEELARNGTPEERARAVEISNRVLKLKELDTALDYMALYARMSVSALEKLPDFDLEQ